MPLICIPTVVSRNNADIVINNLNQIYDGNIKPVTVTNNSVDVIITYNGSTNPPTNPGNYNIQVLSSLDSSVLASAILVIAKATATISLLNTGDILQTGNPIPVTYNVSPSNLVVNVTYNGESTPPSIPGTYEIIATVIDNFYEKVVTSTLNIIGSSISGKAKDSSDAGVQWIVVNLYELNLDESRKSEIPVANYFTAANGEYTLSNIKYGFYEIEFSGDPLHYSGYESLDIRSIKFILNTSTKSIDGLMTQTDSIYYGSSTQFPLSFRGADRGYARSRTIYIQQYIDENTTLYPNSKDIVKISYSAPSANASIEVYGTNILNQEFKYINRLGPNSDTFEFVILENAVGPVKLIVAEHMGYDNYMLDIDIEKESINTLQLGLNRSGWYNALSLFNMTDRINSSAYILPMTCDGYNSFNFSRKSGTFIGCNFTDALLSFDITSPSLPNDPGYQITANLTSHGLSQFTQTLINSFGTMTSLVSSNTSFTVIPDTYLDNANLIRLDLEEYLTNHYFTFENLLIKVTDDFLYTLATNGSGSGSGSGSGTAIHDCYFQFSVPDNFLTVNSQAELLSWNSSCISSRIPGQYTKYIDFDLPIDKDLRFTAQNINNRGIRLYLTHKNSNVVIAQSTETNISDVIIDTMSLTAGEYTLEVVYLGNLAYTDTFNLQLNWYNS